MTDKNEHDHETDAKNTSVGKAFKRLAYTEALKPSYELDEMILQHAAGAPMRKVPLAVASASTGSEPGTQNELEKTVKSVEDTKESTVTSLSFRPKKFNTGETRKKKNVLPRWAMPVGLAATVMLTFGVVTRVMQSPEFFEVNNTAVPAVSGAFDNGNYQKTEVFKNMDADAVNDEAKQSRAESVAASAKIPMAASPAIDQASEKNNQSIANVQADAELPQRESRQNTEAQLYDAKDSVAAKRVRSSESSELSGNTARADAPAEADVLVQATLPQAANAQIIKEDLSHDPGALDKVSESGERIKTLSVAETEGTLKQASQAAGSSTITGPLGESTDLNKSKSTLLSDVLPEHQECRVNFDCALLAPECNTCDCLEPVNLSNFSKYDSEFSVLEIQAHCPDTKTECVNNTCQIIGPK